MKGGTSPPALPPVSLTTFCSGMPRNLGILIRNFFILAMPGLHWDEQVFRF